MPLIDAINEEQSQFIERAEQFEKNPDLVRSIIIEGSEAARELRVKHLKMLRCNRDFISMTGISGGSGQSDERCGEAN
ncbi:MAG: hypothetical protein CM1200mP9_00550 [Gammaproteobacteria bacterium]|nr:MAG: hypothetical protein CM1200mP9_00550 [Gammaproteobacteria bacterium]